MESFMGGADGSEPLALRHRRPARLADGTAKFAEIERQSDTNSGHRLQPTPTETERELRPNRNIIKIYQVGMLRVSLHFGVGFPIFFGRSCAQAKP